MAQCQKYSKTADEVEKKVTTFGENIHLEKFKPYIFVGHIFYPQYWLCKRIGTFLYNALKAVPIMKKTNQFHIPQLVSQTKEVSTAEMAQNKILHY